MYSAYNAGPDPYQMNTDPKHALWCADPVQAYSGADPSAENGSDPDMALEILKHIDRSACMCDIS
jgi:hypothetical protein